MRIAPLVLLFALPALAGQRIVVDFVDGTTKAQFDALETAWGIDLEFNSEEEGPRSGITTTHATYDGELEVLLAQIRRSPLVEAAEPLMEVTASFVPDDPRYGEQWNLKLINMEQAWERSTGKGVVVAVLDTGIAWENHDDFVRVPDLQDQRFQHGWDFVNDDAHANDDHGHGTHVAGTIAQATDNGEGVAGVAFDATLMPVKVLDHFGSGNTADIADAIRWAADHGAKVLNLSLGGGGYSAVMEQAVAYARAKGAVVVCAAGNGGRGVVEFPAAYPLAFAVGAVGPSGTKAPYSSWGRELDLAAPGGDKSQGEAAGVLQNTIDPQDVGRAVYASFQGTSMATPHVAGVAALLFAAGAKSPEAVEAALTTGAKLAAGQQGWSEEYGHGLLDAAGALTALEGSAAAASPVEVASYRATNWAVFGWAAALLAFVLLTLGRKERPGYLNVLLTPGFLVPLLVTTVGVFFVSRFAGPSSVTATLALPLPDWLGRIIFGRGTLANPLVYSALLPAVLATVAVKVKGLRPAVGGLSIGFAAILGYSLWAQAPALAWLPFTFLAIPWLACNALVCLFLARALLRKEA